MSTKTQAEIDYARAKKQRPSISLTHAGYTVRIVLDRKGIAYPIWSGGVPLPMWVRLFESAFHKAARSLGAKGWVRV